MTNLLKLLEEYQPNFAPLFDPALTAKNTLMMDFSATNPELQALNFTHIPELNDFVFQQIAAAGKKYGYGGYLEDREVYRRSPLFALSPETARSIHLGVDIWAPAQTPVYCPLEGQVHSFANNDNYGDYGPTIILEHRLMESTFYTLYGHLSLESIEGLYEGRVFSKGERLCWLGNYPVNGDWPPHLHFQVMTTMQGYKGDYPGVCSQQDKEKYRQICPDPRLFFFRD